MVESGVQLGKTRFLARVYYLDCITSKWKLCGSTLEKKIKEDLDDLSAHGFVLGFRVGAVGEQRALADFDDVVLDDDDGGVAVSSDARRRRRRRHYHRVVVQVVDSLHLFPRLLVPTRSVAREQRISI